MLLYHTGFDEIRDVDLHRGRANADFGQGFYLTDNRDFSMRWARERKGKKTLLNIYELDIDSSLLIKVFDRDESWFSYIYANRRAVPDSLSEYDIIRGPIACDTIYDVMGITTSGLLTKEVSLKLLMLGPIYRQIVIKTDRALEHLRFIRSELITSEAIALARQLVASEEETYQEEFARVLEEADIQ